MNYEPFIERDLAAIPAAVAEFRAAHSAEETWTAVTRFAVLAFAPSQHSMHALLACLSVWDLREDLGGRFDDAIVQCAIYAAASRQPWSEPPMLDPPKIEADQRGDVDELREAIAASDRLRAERWLAKRYRRCRFRLRLLRRRFRRFRRPRPQADRRLRRHAPRRSPRREGEIRDAAGGRVGDGCCRGVGSWVWGVGVWISIRLCGALVANVIAKDGDIVSAHAIVSFRCRAADER